MVSRGRFSQEDLIPLDEIRIKACADAIQGWRHMGNGYRGCNS